MFIDDAFPVEITKFVILAVVETLILEHDTRVALRSDVLMETNDAEEEDDRFPVKIFVNDALPELCMNVHCTLLTVIVLHTLRVDAVTVPIEIFGEIMLLLHVIVFDVKVVIHALVTETLSGCNNALLIVSN